ncbi:heme oxygenase-like protein, partial [Thozetella sp. PMI_491]
LGDAINGATRSLHAELNRLVVSRIQLALPPHVANPSAYATGLLHVAPIYITFESLWRDLITQREDTKVDSLVQYILSQLRLPGLMRSSALRSDIKALTGWPEHVIEEQLRATSTKGNLQHFLSGMKASVEQNPHVIIAYAWIFYMALFSGGKFIKKFLEQADGKFWAAERDPVRPSLLPCVVDPSLLESLHPGEAGIASGDAVVAEHVLAFFRFDTPSGGEDLKLEFKKRFAESGPLLTAQECSHVVQEAVAIFENTILLVSQLDELFRPASPSPWILGSLANLLAPRLGSRLQDSVAIAKERGLRTTKLAEEPERR